ncbi:MAG: GTA-gp10 family protein [Hyphomonas sp.]
MSERRGTIRFEADGTGHALRLGTNQLAEAEDAFGLPINAIIQRMQGKDVKVFDLRRFFAIAAGVPETEAGDLMDAVGIDRAGELLGEAMAAAFPAPEKDAGKAVGNVAGNGRRRTRTS